LEENTACHYHTTPRFHTLQHDATRCNTHCNTMQHAASHTATRCNTLQHTLQHDATRCNTHCNTLQHAATHYKRCMPPLAPRSCELTLQHTATRCNTLQHIAADCSTVHHTATNYTAHHPPAHTHHPPAHTSRAPESQSRTATHRNTPQHTAPLQHTTPPTTHLHTHPAPQNCDLRPWPQRRRQEFVESWHAQSLDRCGICPPRVHLPNTPQHTAPLQHSTPPTTHLHIFAHPVCTCQNDSHLLFLSPHLLPCMCRRCVEGCCVGVCCVGSCSCCSWCC